MPRENYKGPDARFAVASSEPQKCPNPAHRDSSPSYHIYPDGGYCFGCGYHETAVQVIVRLGKHLRDIPDYREGVDPPGYARAGRSGPARDTAHHALVAAAHATLLHPDSPFRDKRDWFRGRGFSDLSIVRYRFGYWPDHYVIPLWSGESVVGVKLRRDDDVVEADEEPKYRNPPGSSQVVVRPNVGRGRTGPRVVVEGELDAYLVAQYGYDTITTNSGASSIPRMLERDRLNYGPVYVCADNDEPGQEMLRGIQAVWNGRVYQVEFEGKDISEALLSYPEKERKSRLNLWMQYAIQL